MTKKIEDKNYTFFMGYKQLTGNSRIGFKKEVLFDKGDGIIFFESEKSLYKKKKEGDADQYEMRGDNIVYYELSDAQMDNHSEKDSYVKEEDDKKQKKNWVIGLDKDFYATILGCDIDSQKEEFKKLMKIEVDVNANGSGLDEDAKGKLLFDLEDKILDLNQKLIENATISDDQALDLGNPNSKYDEYKVENLQIIAEDRGKKLSPFKVSGDGDNKYLSNKHIAHILSVLNIEMNRAHGEPVVDIDKSKSVDKVKDALGKFSKMGTDKRYELINFIQDISNTKQLDGTELGVGLGRTVKTRLKLNHILSENSNQNVIKGLIGSDGLNQKELSALVILISKSIQLAAQGAGYHDHNKIAITLDKMHFPEDYNKYIYGNKGSEGHMVGKVEARPGSNEEVKKPKNKVGLVTSNIGSSFDPEVLNKVVSLKMGAESAIGDDDEAMSRASDITGEQDLGGFGDSGVRFDDGVDLQSPVRGHERTGAAGSSEVRSEASDKDAERAPAGTGLKTEAAVGVAFKDAQSPVAAGGGVGDQGPLETKKVTVTEDINLMIQKLDKHTFKKSFSLPSPFKSSQSTEQLKTQFISNIKDRTTISENESKLLVRLNQITQSKTVDEQFKKDLKRDLNTYLAATQQAAPPTSFSKRRGGGDQGEISMVQGEKSSQQDASPERSDLEIYRVQEKKDPPVLSRPEDESRFGVARGKTRQEARKKEDSKAPARSPSPEGVIAPSSPGSQKSRGESTRHPGPSSSRYV